MDKGYGLVILSVGRKLLWNAPYEDAIKVIKASRFGSEEVEEKMKKWLVVIRAYPVARSVVGLFDFTLVRLGY